jgi:hypothetical protein
MPKHSLSLILGVRTVNPFHLLRYRIDQGQRRLLCVQFFWVAAG